MRWGRSPAGRAERVPQLTQITQKLRARVLAMPFADQEIAQAAALGMISAGKGLRVLPKDVTDLLQSLVGGFAARMFMPGGGNSDAKAERMMREILDGWPELAEPILVVEEAEDGS